jgi:hypothetical protein
MDPSAEIITAGRPRICSNRCFLVLQDLQDTQHGDYTRLTSNGIPIPTLRRWHKKLVQNPNWTPRDTPWGKHRRIFTGAEDTTISIVIYENNITPRRRFTNKDSITLTVDHRLMKFADNEKLPFFKCSPGFIRSFKNRNRFSLHGQHFKRRPAAS